MTRRCLRVPLVRECRWSRRRLAALFCDLQRRVFESCSSTTLFATKAVQCFGSEPERSQACRMVPAF
ncbi:hypothetical protein LWI28_012528 [Acer negundo]|uniref:Uncharacterized protein n=1 Tax=Acer negundo TaxID=4023 RepID=A0AAD5J0P0_ACENE|nr:hypothetical protein LWI28_012528 [Acer negundo]